MANEIRNVFDVGARALTAQMQRLNTTASNIANAGAVSSSAEEAFRPLRPVFDTAFSAAMGDGVLAAPAERGLQERSVLVLRERGGKLEVANSG